MKYTGSCHCGAVRFEIESEPITKGMSCNCSICRRKGWLLTFVPEANFTLLSGEDHLTKYQFNKKVISHLFCNICGTQSFSKGEGDMAGTVAVNILCLEGIDEESLTIDKFNGKDI